MTVVFKKGSRNLDVENHTGKVSKEFKDIENVTGLGVTV